MSERSSFGIKAGIFGILCNIVLALSKFIVALLSGSVSLLADAANNLFDSVSCITSIIGFRISAKAADKEHPYGHGRMEYFVGLVISLLIIVTAVEFLKSSILKLISPSKPEWSLVYILIPAASIIIKIFMGVYYGSVARRIDSPTVRAQAIDSFSDAALTTVVLAALLLSRVSNFPFDGVAGVIASLVVLFSGIMTVRSVMSPLLGENPSDDLVRGITAEIMKQEHILGVHDLLIHEYGAESIIASVHVEMPATLSFNEAHQLVTKAERAVNEKFGVNLTIHGDPVDVDAPALQKVRYELKSLLQEIDPALAYHDLRLEPDNGHTDVVFDLVIPYSIGEDISQIRDRVADGLRSIDSTYDPKIVCDRI